MTVMTYEAFNQTHAPSERWLFITGVSMAVAQDCVDELNETPELVADLLTESGADYVYGTGKARFAITEDTNGRPEKYAVWMLVVGAHTGPGYPGDKF